MSTHSPIGRRHQVESLNSLSSNLNECIFVYGKLSNWMKFYFKVNGWWKMYSFGNGQIPRYKDRTPPGENGALEIL